MRNYNKSYPAPLSLILESEKSNGKYDGHDVRLHLDKDFAGKCYLTEEKVLDQEVEHFKPHLNRTNRTLLFDWNNLYNSSKKSNGFKGNRFNVSEETQILDCCNNNHKVTNWLEYSIELLDASIKINPVVNTQICINTCDLLNDIFNGTFSGIQSTPKRKIDAKNLRESVTKEVSDFMVVLKKFMDSNSEDDRCVLESKLNKMNKDAVFTSFMIWKIKELADESLLRTLLGNEEYNNFFVQ
jgi:hypothetical protein